MGNGAEFTYGMIAHAGDSPPVAHIIGAYTCAAYIGGNFMEGVCMTGAPHIQVENSICYRVVVCLLFLQPRLHALRVFMP